MGIGSKGRVGLLLCIIFVVAAGCGDDDYVETADAGPRPDAATSVDAPLRGDTMAPRFAGVVLAFSAQPDRLTMVWPPAVDETSAESTLTYRVYVGTDAATLVAPGNLRETVVAATTVQVAGLAAATAYSVAVVAVDEAGNATDATDGASARRVTVTTLAVPLVLSTTPKDIESMQLSVTVVGPDAFTLGGGDVSGFAAGDVLVIPHDGHQLKRIVSITPTAGEAAIITEDVSLPEIINSGGIAMNASVPSADLLGATESLMVDRPTAEGGTEMVTARRYTDPSGMFVLTDYSPPGSSSGRLRVPEQLAAGGNIDLGGGLTLGYFVDFTPSMKAEFSCCTGLFPPLPTKVSLIGEGRFIADATARYNVSAGFDRSAAKRVVDRSVTLRYTVAGLPVVQTVSLRIDASMQAKVAATLDAEATAHAEKFIRVGVEYDPTNSWSLVKEDGFDQSVAFSVAAKGTATADVKFEPRLSTSLYGVSEASLTVTPTVDLDAAVRFLPPPAEVTKFDVAFWVDVVASAVLIKVLGVGNYTSPRVRLIDLPLFSMPSLSVQASTGCALASDTVTVNLNAIDGTNNAVADSAISWSVQPNTGVTLTPSADGRSAQLSGSALGAYEVTAAAFGDGFLGTVGTRYATATVRIADSCAPVTPDSIVVLGTAVDPAEPAVPAKHGFWLYDLSAQSRRFLGPPSSPIISRTDGLRVLRENFYMTPNLSSFVWGDSSSTSAIAYQLFDLQSGAQTSVKDLSAAPAADFQYGMTLHPSGGYVAYEYEDRTVSPGHWVNRRNLDGSGDSALYDANQVNSAMGSRYQVHCGTRDGKFSLDGSSIVYSANSQWDWPPDLTYTHYICRYAPGSDQFTETTSDPSWGKLRDMQPIAGGGFVGTSTKITGGVRNLVVLDAGGGITSIYQAASVQTADDIVDVSARLIRNDALFVLGNNTAYKVATDGSGATRIMSEFDAVFALTGVVYPASTP